jgi:hypothetical protein
MWTWLAQICKFNIVKLESADNTLKYEYYYLLSANSSRWAGGTNDLWGALLLEEGKVVSLSF